MANLYYWLVWLVCSSWIVLTILSQINNKSFKKIYNFDKLGLIPVWTFFAPKPGSTDMHLLFRYVNEGSFSPWQESELTSTLIERNKLLRSIFNPYRRVEKMLFDFTNDIGENRHRPEQIRHLTEYILILSYLEKLTDKTSKGIQFMLAGSNTVLLKDLEVYVVSDIHYQ